MSMAIGMINGGCSSSWIQQKSSLEKNGRRSVKRVFSVSSSLREQYKTLRIQPGATETDVKKAFRKLALQYHPDVCKGNNCGIQFNQINEAYNILLSNLRGEGSNANTDPAPAYSNSTKRNAEVVYEEEEDYWEEWMGWEGAGIRDYSSHINPYIYHD